MGFFFFFPRSQNYKYYGAVAGSLVQNTRNDTAVNVKIIFVTAAGHKRESMGNLEEQAATVAGPTNLYI